MQIIDGRYYAAKVKELLRGEISAYHLRGKIRLKIILVGNDHASLLYVNNKIKAASNLDISAELTHFDTNISQQELITKIQEYNLDPQINAIIVQLPLPAHINRLEVIEQIAPTKDVDGFHPTNIGYLHAGIDKGFIPCTPLGCLYLLKQIHLSMVGLNAVVIGCSNIVGKPMAALLLQEKATVTICHSATRDLAKICRNADILISATGVAGLITAEHVKDGATIIDVGISRIAGGISGDVNFKEVAPKASHITPVPGGVGPMTISFLLANCLKAARRQNV